MNDLIVVTGSTLPPTDSRTGTLGLYLNQLAAAGIESSLTLFADMPLAEGGAPGTLGLYITCIRDIARKFASYERIVATDGWDVMFYGTKEDVIRKIPLDRCLIGAAKECYPWGVGVRERTSTDTPWRYANGGLLAGTPENFHKLAEVMESHPKYRPRLENQGMQNIMLADKSDVFHHDSRTELFFCLFDGYAELDFERGLPVNTLCETKPQFIHANGHWDTAEMLDKYKRSLQ